MCITTFSGNLVNFLVKYYFRWVTFILIDIITFPYNWIKNRVNHKLEYKEDRDWYVNQKRSDHIKRYARTEEHAKWELMMFNRGVVAAFFWVLSNDIYLILTTVYSIFFIKLPRYVSILKEETKDYYLINYQSTIFIFFFIYFVGVVILTTISYFFGVKGIFSLSSILIMVFWYSQLYLMDSFFFDSITLRIDFEFLSYTIGTASFKFSLKIDFISYCFLFLTTSIGVCAVVYSLSYFKNEPHTDRFILLLNWFILSMSLLVTADNAILLFLGWELIGLTSFLLINFWTLRRGTLKSAFKAFTFNKISDVFLLFFIIILGQQTGSFSLTNWYAYYIFATNYQLSHLLVPALFLILASSIKSAQVLGHLWLPDSMEAPIPASALIHSATLVSAGVYLLLKFSWIIKCSNLLPFVLFLGALTALYGALVSAAQTDCKKLLAYSTISHCGFLFITIGLGNTFLTITYLYLHGFFKALTFFCVGNLVKVCRGYQDTRKMGQLFLVLPVESILLVICAINLGALPFTVGYFYKSLLQATLVNIKLSALLIPFIFLAMLASVVYVFRLVFYSLFDTNKGNLVSFDSYFQNVYNKDDYSNTTTISIFFIFLLLVFSVYIYFFYFLFLNNFIFFNSCFDFDYFSSIQNIQNSVLGYYYYFYIFFGVICLVLLRVECRSEFSYFKKNFMLLSFVLLILFIQFNVIILSLFS